jgi:uncharacterized protein YndB with AHSA1/START domain
MDILHDFPINAPISRVYSAVTAPAGLDQWWTKKSSGKPARDAEYQLWFGPKFDWRAKVVRAVADKEFELEITKADPDWIGTRVGVTLESGNGATQVRFHHTGWPVNNEHYRISCYCWAMYLRILKRFLEHEERVAYEDRLNV